MSSLLHQFHCVPGTIQARKRCRSTRCAAAGSAARTRCHGLPRVRAAFFEDTCSPAMAPIVGTHIFQPSPIFLKAPSFLGSTKPEWTRRRRVPFSPLEKKNETTVPGGEPYPTFPSCPLFQA